MGKENMKVCPKMLEEFKIYLEERENSPATISKYLRDVRTFFKYNEGCGEINKEQLLKYKDWLMENYAVNSVNSMLVALNQFLSFLELGRLKVKRIRVQGQGFANMGKELTKHEFYALVDCARKQNKRQLAMMMETMCATGVRVSELKFFRVENIRNGMVKVWNKGKYRLVILPGILQKKLLYYIKKEKIHSGMIFCTKSGKEKDRSNIWREMKKLAVDSKIDAKKIFPHNLRHLFARTFYKITKNLINLADILGHSNLEVTRIYASEGFAEWRRNIELMKILETT